MSSSKPTKEPFSNVFSTTDKDPQDLDNSSSGLGATFTLPSGISSLLTQQRQDVLSRRSKKEDNMDHENENDNDNDNDNKHGNPLPFMSMSALANQLTLLSSPTLTNLNNETKNILTVSSSSPFENEENEQDSINYHNTKDDPDYDDENDDEIMRFEPKHDNDDESEANNDDDDQDDEDDSDDNSSIVSQNPPSTYPILIVSLEKFYGYIPIEPNELDQMKHHFLRQLLGKHYSTPKDDIDVDDDDHDNEWGDEESLEFINRSVALFESGAAIHATAPISSDTVIMDSNDTDTLMLTATSYHTNLHNCLTENQLHKILESFALHDMDVDENLNNHDNDNKADSNAPPPYCMLPYPEYIYDTHSSQAIPLLQIWKTIQKNHTVPIVQHLFQHLQTTNQPLLWKYHMSQQIRSLVQTQIQQQTKYEQMSRLYEWKTETRPKQLDQLYQVRDTLEEQYHQAQDSLYELEQVREKTVQIQLRQYIQNKGDQYDVELLDVLNLGAGELLQPSIDDLLMGRHDASLYHQNDDASSTDDEGEDNHNHNDDDDYDGYEHDKDVEDDDYDDGNDDESLDDPEDTQKTTTKAAVAVAVAATNKTAVTNTNTSLPTLPLPLPSRNHKKARHRKSSKRLKKKLLQQQHLEKLNARKEQIDIVKQEQHRLREENTSYELRMAQMVCQTLDKKRTQVEDLLESLQEEEWADDEEGIIPKMEDELNTWNDGDDDDDDDDNSDGSEKRSLKWTLLDQMLAMILGKLPRMRNVSVQQHYHTIQSEHSYIVKEWKKQFGRLPRSTSGDEKQSSPQQENQQREKEKHVKQEEDVMKMRLALGITDNDGDDDWEDLDWEDVLPGISKDSSVIPSDINLDAMGEGSPTKKEEGLNENVEQNENTKSKLTPKQRTAGLRPGGRVS